MSAHDTATDQRSVSPCPNTPYITSTPRLYLRRPSPASVVSRAPVRARPATADAVPHFVAAQAHPIALARWGPRAGAGHARPSPRAAPSPGLGNLADRALDATGVASMSNPSSADQSNPSRADVYARITDEIIAAIDKGAGAKSGSWRAPWHHNGSAVFRPSNVLSGHRYRWVNVLALWAASEARGFSCGLWGTYRQWAARGAQVRKGEQSSLVVFWKTSRANGDDEDGAEDQDSSPTKLRFFARLFRVQRRARRCL